MALPWIIGGVAVVAGKMIYDAVTDDGSYSYSDREEREREAIEGAKQKENKKILIDINSFKKQEISYIYEKYGYTIHIDNSESFSKEIHQILKNASSDILTILKSKFGNSFINSKGDIKEDILEEHIENIKYIFEMKIIKELDFIEDIEYFTNEDIKSIFGFNIEKFFEKELENIEYLIDYFRYSNQSNVFERIKNIYKIEKVYRSFIKKYKDFHQILIDDEIRQKIEQYILDNIGIYAYNFSNTNIKVLSSHKKLLEEANILEKEIVELEEALEELNKIKGN